MQPKPGILEQATAQQLVKAAAHNHRTLFFLNAQAQGGETKESGGLAWTYCGPGKEAMIAFPDLDEAEAGARLDEMMDYYRQHPPGGAGCWSLHPPRPADLGIRLLARGFRPGWRPCWMALDLQAMQTGHAAPEALQITADNDTPLEQVKELPYAGDSGAISDALLRAAPQQVQRFVARLQGKIVGQSCVLFSSGEYGAAGIYNVGVVPRARQQGIGKALVLAACSFAKEKGYNYAVLNATGRRMYEQAGFRWLGDGFTWWLNHHRFNSHPPSPAQVALAEAAGRGDLPALSRLGEQFTGEQLSAPLTNGMTPVELALHCRQTAAAEWLLAHGATCTALNAWDLGWKDRAAALLAEQPAEANRRYGNWQATILHIAVERNDMALVRLALSAKPDLEIKDIVYNSTALGWAEALERNEMAALIRSAAKR